MAYIFVVLRDIVYVLLHGGLPEDRVGCYVESVKIGVIVVAWAAIATVVLYLGVLAIGAARGSIGAASGSIGDASDAALMLWLFSWPAVYVGGSFWTYRRHRRW
jgi:hypothetical protein